MINRIGSDEDRAQAVAVVLVNLVKLTIFPRLGRQDDKAVLDQQLTLGVAERNFPGKLDFAQIDGQGVVAALELGRKVNADRLESGKGWSVDVGRWGRRRAALGGRTFQAGCGR